MLQQKHVTLVSSKENIDTNTPQGRFVLSIFAALSELEREQTLQRQREGNAIAKSQGKYKGRQPLPIDWEKFGQLYEQWKSGTITAVWFQKEMGLQANTFYRRLKEYKRKIKQIGASRHLPAQPLSIGWCFFLSYFKNPKTTYMTYFFCVSIARGQII